MKGRVSGWKGKHPSEETRAKMRAAKLGRQLTPEHKAKIGAATRGIPLSEEHKAKISMANTGKVRTAEMRERVGLAGRGRVVSYETKVKISRAHSGEKSYLWRGGITPKVKLLRGEMECRNWRVQVLRRDNSTCRGCGKREGCLHAHHIKPFESYPELRLDLNNGLTLCPACHRKAHSKIHQTMEV